MTNKAEFLPRLISCLQSGYSRADFSADAIAGLTVGIVALPLAMALAIASGLTPERGLITAVAAGFIISVLGGCRVQIGGPTGAFVVIVADIVSRRGYEGLAAATFLAGIILIILGLAKLGRMIKFIPHPVTTGFTSGIAVVIFSTQIKDFFGLTIEHIPGEFIAKWQLYYENISSYSPHALTIGLASLGLLVVFRRIDPRIPGALIVVVLSSLAVSIFGLPIETIGTRFGQIPSTIPLPHLPVIDLSSLRDLLPDAFTIAMLAGIESLLSAVVADGMTGEKHKSNMELVAQGIANIGSVLFGGIPATGAIARTATNIKSGAKTPIAGILHAAVLLAFMLFLAPLASLIPLPTLAAILFLVAWNMSDIDRFHYLLRAPRGDVAVLLTTFFLTILVDLTLAVEVGMVLAAMLFMKRMSEVTDSIASQDLFAEDENGLDLEAINVTSRARSPGVEIYEVNGPFFFGMADRFKDALQRVEINPRVIILRLRKVPVIDGTALFALSEFHLKCRRDKVRLILSEVQPAVFKAIRKIGLVGEIGEQNFSSSIEKAMQTADSTEC